ncbi:hypothetical protein MCG45_16335 [Clostridium perfringens]|uniref:hypothetical protein n=1 Tax=Clostridium perfringens TaxID=1502 RepID=UPI001F053E20|nr:hypothetical protein [Clostridium perfringens]MCH1964399.1 hypothetical protein [Clostridium perfringens]
MEMRSRFVLECEDHGVIIQFKEGDKVKMMDYNDEEVIGKITDIDVEYLVLDISKEFESRIIKKSFICIKNIEKVN